MRKRKLNKATETHQCVKHDRAVKEISDKMVIMSGWWQGRRGPGKEGRTLKGEVGLTVGPGSDVSSTRGRGQDRIPELKRKIFDATHKQ